MLVMPMIYYILIGDIPNNTNYAYFLFLLYYIPIDNFVPNIGTRIHSDGPLCSNPATGTGRNWTKQQCSDDKERMDTIIL